ncbi:hypothetical protein AKJ09_02212 [Labilithrix luteola]|uniref:Serine aminopeptidase S33 domain-containing protein n=1 Tax=Labilithrix luteola TaxID=1391654 RepID=A0A0K1PPU6_9BACT|nr:alpha/beta fold hydrolase [Labilithrix luteola]AKU95548.1 hypothetical protein AKJ09_02212 [Labilithrix luteola]
MRSPRGVLLFVSLMASVFAYSSHESTATAGGDDWDDDSDCDGVDVREMNFPVSLSDGHQYRVAGYAYTSRHVKHRTVQLLVHGATYNHSYWDGPELGKKDYSYAREMAKRGYLVIAIDQLGTGHSDKPDGDFFSLQEAASSLHQVAGQVRSWAGPRSKLAFVGHSNGSVTSIYTQGTYGDADLLITTGWVHGFRGLPVDPSDPEIQGAVATPYINFRGPKRDALMYFTPKTDAAMISYDDAHLTDTMPRHQFFDLIGIHGEIAALGPGGMTTSTRSQQVRVPTLVQVGERDDAIAPPTAGPPSEAAFYPNVRDLTVHKLSQIGHCVNLHVNHKESWKDIDRWISAHD